MSGYKSVNRNKIQVKAAQKTFERRKPSSMKPKELTIRGLILGALITTIFTAGLTFASSIPAAVISMAMLGVLGFVGIIIWLYWWMLSRNKTVVNPKSTPRTL
ncbi:MAG TPA: hypothetical protein VFT48_09340 [Pyrinomonadaceae bacterium]|nr:hypothetical protein [Pyrinomonadaceae bacterium]